MLGRGCRIGKGASVRGSYLHDNVTVWDGAVVEAAMLCENVTVHANARVQPGAVLSFQVMPLTVLLTQQIVAFLGARCHILRVR